MERLTLAERRPKSRKIVADTRRRPVSRLPTPEASRSGYDTSDTSYWTEEMEERGLRSDLCHPYQGQSATMPNSPVELSRHPSIIGHQSAPHSPPYPASESFRPSLPPLKTILGQALSSPPQTPVALTSSFQARPQEPPFASATYKPPALYPNKKQRMGPSVRANPSINGARGLQNDFLHDTSSLRQAENFFSADPQHHWNDPDAKILASRRLSVQLPRVPDRRLSTAMHATQDGVGEPTHAPSATEFPNGHHAYFSPDETPTCDTFHRASLSRHSPRRVANLKHPALPYQTRRQSVQTPADMLQDSTAFKRGGLASTSCSTPYEMNGVLDQPYCGTGDEPGRGLAPLFHQSPYDGPHTPFFVSRQYDHQQGKVRKRSNLPKQSTEIMKTWFDQNITNPYPSEEQKALFSHATGISMTQVSNWFINHRRRCPELRDRRDKHRSNTHDLEAV